MYEFHVDGAPYVCFNMSTAVSMTSQEHFTSWTPYGTIHVSKSDDLARDMSYTV